MQPLCCEHFRFSASLISYSLLTAWISKAKLCKISKWELTRWPKVVKHYYAITILYFSYKYKTLGSKINISEGEWSFSCFEKSEFYIWKIDRGVFPWFLLAMKQWLSSELTHVQSRESALLTLIVIETDKPLTSSPAESSLQQLKNNLWLKVFYGVQ